MAAGGPVRLLQGYKRHITSEFLADRYPYLEDIRGHLRPDEVSMAHGDRMFPRLVEQLKTPGMEAEKICEALRTINDLCSNQEYKCQAIGADVVAAATNLLTHESIPVRRDAANVLGSLALLIGGRSLMPIGNTEMSKRLTGQVAAAPTLPRLAKLLLSCDDEIVKMNVARAMKAVTIFRDGCQQAVDQGMIRSIAQYLCATLPDLPDSEEQALCLLYLLQTLAAVTMYADGGMRDLFGVSLIERVVAFLAKVPEDGKLPCASEADSTELMRQALRLLWHVGNDSKGRKETLAASGVEVITSYLEASDSKVREAAVCALNVASLETQGKKDILQHSPKGLAKLLHSGNNETAYLHETCIQLIRSASELPAFRFAFARLIVGSTWLLEKIYGTTSLQAVSPLLRPGEDADTRKQALQVAVHFLSNAGRGDEIRVPPVCPLENIDDPRNFAYEDCVDILHNLVDMLSVAREPAMECLTVLCAVTGNREELIRIFAEGRAEMPSATISDVEGLIR